MIFLGWFLLLLSVPLIIIGWLSTKGPYKFLGIVAIVFAVVGIAILRSQGIDPKAGLPAEMQ
jgi:hypothetical protein